MRNRNKVIKKLRPILKCKLQRFSTRDEFKQANMAIFEYKLTVFTLLGRSLG